MIPGNISNGSAALGYLHAWRMYLYSCGREFQNKGYGNIPVHRHHCFETRVLPRERTRVIRESGASTQQCMPLGTTEVLPPLRMSGALYRARCKLQNVFAIRSCWTHKRRLTIDRRSIVHAAHLRILCDPRALAHLACVLVFGRLKRVGDVPCSKRTPDHQDQLLALPIIV